jgi:hypothetical protein
LDPVTSPVSYINQSIVRTYKTMDRRELFRRSVVWTTIASLIFVIRLLPVSTPVSKISTRFPVEDNHTPVPVPVGDKDLVSTRIDPDTGRAPK